MCLPGSTNFNIGRIVCDKAFIMHFLELCSNFYSVSVLNYKQVFKLSPPALREMINGTPWENARLEYDMFFLHTLWNKEIPNLR